MVAVKYGKGTVCSSEAVFTSITMGILAGKVQLHVTSSQRIKLQLYHSLILVLELVQSIVSCLSYDELNLSLSALCTALVNTDALVPVLSFFIYRLETQLDCSSSLMAKTLKLKM